LKSEFPRSGEMPAPTTVPELLDIVQKSGVVEPARLTAYIDQLRERAFLPTEPKQLAAMMVRDAYLTIFQADQMLQGKWRGFTIGKYRILEKLGSGGMGHVYLGEHKVMRRKVAVKVLPTAKAKEQSSLERFQREARAIAALDHPNLVRAFDIDEDKDLHFLVMEYVDGASLQEIVKRTGPLDPTRACHYIYYAALGLQYAYEVAELVHRDVKPGNIMVDRQGAVKLLDMGLARFFNDEADILTKKYDESVLGTADYLSPEQATDSHEVDIRADIYSLGATFYFLLAGHPPFADGSVAQKLIWHQTRQPKPIRLLRPQVPEGVAAIIERMMLKDPAARYQTPSELAGALSPYVQTPIAPPCEAELPHLCPAAGGALPSERNAAVAQVGVTSGRWALPPVRPGTTAAIGSVSAPTAAQGPLPAGISVAAAKSPQTPRPQPVPSSATVGRRDDVNPFAHLLGGGQPGAATDSAQNVYAVAAARATTASLPAAPTRDATATSVKSSRILWTGAVFIGLIALASGAFVLWGIMSGNAAKWW
jgi:tRNA A-37 threonylcarbamoyl transferase component Bud32